uniref:Putative tail protein n=1 Tax=viral metagenome TaxID=1070528 RepID=A0A6M3J740_9ZZZZ
MIEMELKGWKEVDDALAKLSKELQIKIADNALKQGAIVVRDAARSNMSNMDTGLLRTQIDVGRGKKRAALFATGKHFTWLVGLKKWSSFKGGIPAWYGRFIELGTAKHKLTAGVNIRKGRNYGKTGKKVLYSHKSGKFFGKEVEVSGIKARPFMRPALDNNAQKVTEVIKNFLWAGIANSVMGSSLKVTKGAGK